MAKSRAYQAQGTNRLLDALPRRRFAQLQNDLERISLPIRTVLYEPNQPIPHAYFPLNGVMSIVATTQSGHSVEVATVGNEGMIGMPLFLGADRTTTQAFSQVAGDALRMSATAFQAAISKDAAFRNLIGRYFQTLMNQISQSMACNQLHSVEQRMCRWLLMTHDRVGVDEFFLTQEFLAQMLGVRRAGVTVIAGVLRRARLIAYRRGRITVVNRKALEKASCECYRVVRDEFDRLLK
jgi:CRP-like cAMP-binding protein